MTDHGFDLDERAEEAARNATCMRCQVVILGEASAVGMVFGRIIVPVTGIQENYQLCGKCGLALREFLTPELLQDQHYLGVKTQLLGEFWV